jgi:hypothetical protein
MFTFTSLFGQIKITDVGDGWKGKVEQALDTIKKYDTERYEMVIKTCKVVAFWNGGFATTESDTIITIPSKEISNGNVYNISAILVHESIHLYVRQLHFKIEPNKEEVLCYLYELDFLRSIPNVDDWLIKNAENKIKFYNNK